MPYLRPISYMRAVRWAGFEAMTTLGASSSSASLVWSSPVLIDRASLPPRPATSDGLRPAALWSRGSDSGSLYGSAEPPATCVQVRSAVHGVITLNQLQPDVTIGDLKALVAERIGLSPARRIHLSTWGHEMLDRLSLAQCRVKTNGVLDMRLSLVRLEDKPLSAEEIADATAQPLAYGEHDLVLVDWAAAFVVDAEPAATLAVLEFANVQLVELKHLDSELDRGLDQIWAMANDRSLFSRFRLRSNLRKLAELELEGAALFDGVTNALKLFGDASLARVQRAAGRRFRIEDWEKSIARKLETLGSVSTRLESRQSQYRSELLEWIIIVLIAFEVVKALVS
jgi:hypothetical protein